MTRVLIFTDEDESPRHIGHLADDLGVHQVAEADEHGGDARDDAHVVEYHPALDFQVSTVDPNGYEHTKYASMACQALISRKFPTAVWHVMEWYQHLDEVIPSAEKILWLIEETMSQACSYQYADEDIEEQRLKLLRSYLLFLVEALHQQIAKYQADEPASGVVADCQWTQMRQYWVWVPYDIVK